MYVNIRTKPKEMILILTEEFIIYMEGIKEGSASKRRSTPFLHYSNLKSDRLFNFRSVAATVATAVIFGNNLFLFLEIGILTSFAQGRSRTEND